jgi:hypothetical protein
VPYNFHMLTAFCSALSPFHGAVGRLGAAPPALQRKCPRPAPHRAPRGPQCSSLEDSKKRARSAYDNIPDLHEQYIRELKRAETKYGRDKFPKDVAAEAASPILRPPGVRAKARPAPADSAVQEAGRLRSLAQYRETRGKLLADTAFVGALGVCAGWAFGDVNTAASVALGVAGSIAYVVLLARGVDRLAGSRDPIAPARVALLALLVIGAAKRRETFQVVPVMLGFLSYKLATILPLLTGEAFDDSVS